MKSLYESIIGTNSVDLRNRIRDSFQKRELDKHMIDLLEKSVAIYKPEDEREFRIIKDEYCSIVGRKASLNWIDTSDITDMSYMFNDNWNGDISKWDVSKVTDMNCMFYYSAFDGDISKWNTSKVQNMSHMFARSKFNRDISKWDISSVVCMDSMFEFNKKFNQDLSGWKLNVICDTSYMFNKCPIKEEYKPQITKI